jgi:hypothetical protein
MLKEIFTELDEIVETEHRELRDMGGAGYESCVFKIFGQSALLEAGFDFELDATADLDGYTNARQIIVERLKEILGRYGIKWDDRAEFAWMPEETEWDEIVDGAKVKAYVAKPEYVLLSKAKTEPIKNKNLIKKYLASNPTDMFFKLCDRHGVDLDQFLN